MDLHWKKCRVEPKSGQCPDVRVAGASHIGIEWLGEPTVRAVSVGMPASVRMRRAGDIENRSKVLDFSKVGRIR